MDILISSEMSRTFLFIFLKIAFCQSQFRFPSDYLKETRPAPPGNPVLVNVSVHIEAINPFQVTTMDFRMRIKLMQTWEDLRLTFPPSYFQEYDRFLLPREFIDKIWIPDPNIVNAKVLEVVVVDRKLMDVYIYRNQTVFLSIDFFATLACSLNYQYFPYDFQICPFIVESFSFDRNQVIYKWSSYEPFTIDYGVYLLQFIIAKKIVRKEQILNRIGQGHMEFSRLVALFHFKRSLGNHLIQSFAPCSLILSLSWFSFWLDLDSVAARVSLLVTALLTLVTQFSSFKIDLPPVAYIKCVDIWMAGCMVFMFAALGEFVFVKVIHSEIKKAIERKGHEVRGTLSRGRSPESIDEQENPPTPPPRSAFPLIFRFNKNQIRQRMSASHRGIRNGDLPLDETPETDRMPERLTHKIYCLEIPIIWTDGKTGQRRILWKEIDNRCKWIFPITYVIFCTLYWLTLFLNSYIYAPR